MGNLGVAAAAGRNHVPLGIAYMVDSTAMFAGGNAVVKWQLATYPLGEVAFGRTLLTNAFSKKVENLRAAVSLHFAHYNFREGAPQLAHHAGDGSWREQLLHELVERTSD